MWRMTRRAISTRPCCSSDGIVVAAAKDQPKTARHVIDSRAFRTLVC